MTDGNLLRFDKPTHEILSDAARWRWFRAHFATDHRAAGLHACETPEKLDAWVSHCIMDDAKK